MIRSALLFAVLALSQVSTAIVLSEGQNEVVEENLVEIDIDTADIVRVQGRNLVSDAAGLTINLLYATSATAAQKQGFTAAVTRWTSIITSDTPTVVCVPANTKYCGYKFKKRTCIDDLLIIVKVAKIDGVGNVLGSSGPCGTYQGMSRLGVMTFDSADANTLINQGLWQPTVLHEMAHVLGIGTLWDSNNLITPSGSAAPYYYYGTNGIAGLADMWGSGNGDPVVENLGGDGTARGHWKESVYDTELMTGWIESKGTAMPLSMMTVRALQDLGYSVDTSKADAFPKPSGRRLRGNENKVHLGNDILQLDLVEFGDDLASAKPGRESEFEAKKKEWKAKHKKN